MKFLNVFKSILIVSVITAGATLSCSVVLSKLMKASEYGAYAYWVSVVAIFSNIVPFGAIAIVAVFRHAINLNLFKQRLSHGVFIVMPLVAAILLMAIFIFDKSIDDINLDVMSLSIVTVFLNSFFLVYTSLLRVEQLFKKYATATIIGSFLLVISQIVVWVVFGDVYIVFYSVIIINLILALFSARWLIKNNFVQVVNSKNVKLNMIKWNFSYGLPIVMSSLAMSFLTVGDKILFKNDSNPTEFGEYAKISLTASMVMFFVNNFASAWGTYLSKNLSQLSFGAALKLYKTGLGYSIGVGILLIFSLIPGVVFVYKIIYGDPAVEIVYTLSFLVAGYILYGMSKFHIGFLMYYQRNYAILWATIAACGFLFVGYNLLSVRNNINVSALVFMSYVCFYCIIWYSVVSCFKFK